MRPEDLDAIAALASTCVEVDGGRLKLEWATLRSRPAEVVNDFRWVDERGLVGFLGLYGFRSDQVEMCGMVRPDARRQGVFSSLFDAARSELRRRNASQVLLVVHRGYEAGAAFARSVGGVIEHSEHRMELRRDPAPMIPDPLVSARAAHSDDAPFVMGCVSAAFGLPAPPAAEEEPEPLYLERLSKDLANTRVIDYSGIPVGTVRVDREDGAAGIYGFAVLPQFQGRGIGRQVLSDLARDLPAQGARSVSLEVATSNDAALGLYLSCGFDVMGTEDYFAVPVGRHDP